jgi:hypothetical protein
MLASAAALVLLIGGCVYFSSQRPNFGRSSPVAIELRAGDYAGSITNRAICQSIVGELSKARRVLTVSQFTGQLTIRFRDGGMTAEFFTIKGSRFWIGRASRVFNGDAERLKKLLAEGGADVSRIAR